MVSYLLSATAVIFISVIVSILVPEGKLHKTITFVMRLICILVLIQPAVTLFKLPEETEADFADYGYVAEEYTKSQSRELKKLVDGKFGIDSECTVLVEYSNGNFGVEGAEVLIPEENSLISEDIYAYLEELGYINISVYAKSS